MFLRLVTLGQLLWQYNMDKIAVEGHPHLYRDIKSGAIINTNSTDYSSYMEGYQTRQQQSYRIDKIENELSEIKGLLKQLMEKL
jgi:hypothetical protein